MRIVRLATFKAEHLRTCGTQETLQKILGIKLPLTRQAKSLLLLYFLCEPKLKNLVNVFAHTLGLERAY